MTIEHNRLTCCRKCITEADEILVLTCHPIEVMSVTAALEGVANCDDNHRRLLGHRARQNRVAVVVPGNCC